MNITHIKNYDVIKNLPVDENIKLSNSEVEILNLVFNDSFESKEKKDNIKKITQEIQDPIFGGILFIILSLPFIDNFLLDFIQNKWLLIIKATIFMILFWFLSKIKTFGR